LPESARIFNAVPAESRGGSTSPLASRSLGEGGEDDANARRRRRYQAAKPRLFANAL